MKRKIYFLMYDECIVHGGFFDNFEYYYIVKQVFKDCDVKWRCITNHSRDDVLDILQDKYQDIEPKVYKDIEVVKHISRKFYRDPLMIDVLICPTNSAMYWFLEHGNIQAAKSYIGLGDWKDIHPKQNKYYKNHVVLCDERIFDYGESCNWRPYRKKILFDKYKQKEYGQEYDNLLNLSLVERRFSREYMEKVMNTFPGTWAAYTGHKNEKYYAWINERQDSKLIIPPVKDFMGLFNRFVYLPYKDGTDATPRLIPECVYYNKKISYYDYSEKDIVKSGGYYRYQDTKNDFESLWLKNNDEIISIIEDIL